MNREHTQTETGSLKREETGYSYTGTLTETAESPGIQLASDFLTEKPEDSQERSKESGEDGLEIPEAVSLETTSSYILGSMSREIGRFRMSIERKTGFANLDREAGGLFSGLYCVAAVSSLGKTTFLLQMADQLAAAGQDVLFFSLEQSRLELVSKSIARLTAKNGTANAVTSLSVRKGDSSQAVREAAAEYISIIGNRMTIADDNIDCSLSFLERRIQEYTGLTSREPVVIIDYLQIMQPTERYASAKEAVDSIVVGLKRLSRRYDIPILMISSVNRAGYLTPIDFESLKESGGIEYTCDVVWGLQLAVLSDPAFEAEKKINAKRETVKREKRADPRKIELVCLKNRYGIANFSVFFKYYAEYDLFVPAESREELNEEAAERY